jgi:hypothetical protein
MEPGDVRQRVLVVREQHARLTDQVLPLLQGEHLGSRGKRRT